MILQSEQAPTVLGGRYRLEVPIGDGGMGRAFRAHDELLDRPVAVKLLDTTLFPSALEEARSAGQLNHPGVIQVFDVGVHGPTGYIVLELVPGRSLRDVLRQTKRLPPKLAVDIAVQLADALAAAHRAGLVHCDVKPMNILITREGRTKLIDFGIACRATDTARDANEEVRGSAPYLAPEQARGEPLDARTDVYALGTVLYEMLVGRPPFRGATAAEVVVQRLTADPPPPRSIDPRVPTELERVVLRALARDPGQRYADAGQTRDALRAAIDARSGWRTSPAWQLLRHSHRRAVAAAAIFMVVGGLALAGWSSAHQQSVRVPTLVGHAPTEAPSLLEQAGIPQSDLTVLTRPVDSGYVGKIVDQQPQPGAPLNSSDGVQIAVGVPADASVAPVQRPATQPPVRELDG